MLDLRWLLPLLKTYNYAIWIHGLSTISGDSYGHKLYSILPLFSYCHEKHFMSNLHKSKQSDLIDMLNDTSWYLDDKLIIDNPEFEKHTIHPTELQLNNSNTSDKETSFLDLNKKVIGSDVIPAFMTNAITSDFISSIPLAEWWYS